MRTKRSRGTAAVLACVAAAAVASAPSRAAPQSLAVLAVAPPPGPGPELVAVTARVREQIALRSAGTLDGDELERRMAPAAPAAPVAEIERAYDAARVAYLRGDYERSLALLRGAVAEAERRPEGDAARAIWTKAMMRLARTQLDLGRAEAARASVGELVRAVPDVAVDRALQPARLVEEIENARAAQKGRTGTLVISCATAGARVYVDGRDVGTAPVRLEVPRGRHRVSAAVGDARTVAVADVGEEGRELHLDPTIAAALRPSRGPGLALEAAGGDRRILAAGAHLAVDRVVAVRVVHEGGLAYAVGALHDVRRGTLEREGRVKLAGGKLPAEGSVALAELLVNGRAPSPLVELEGGRGAFAPSSPPPLPTSPGQPVRLARVSLGVRIGFARASGNVASATASDEWVKSQFPVQADVLARVTRRLSVGVYGSYGYAQPGGDVKAWCDAPSGTCILFVARVGLQAVFEFEPGAAGPWVGAGLGYEWNKAHVELDGGNGGADVTAQGPELLKLQGGVDWKLARGVSAGPFAMISLGRYDRVEATDPWFTAAGEAGQIHVWTEIGLRCRFGL
jgi:hypothetical protein